MDHFPKGEQPKLVTVDEFLNQVKNPEFLTIAIKGSHHRNLSFWFLHPPYLGKVYRLMT